MDPSDLRVDLATETIRRRTFDNLFQAILDGYFKPGERLIERELCELTGVSRSSVREALRQLEAEGLVVIAPNRGPAVATMDAAAAREIYEMREAIEGKAAGLFVERATAADVAAVQGALARGIDAAERRDVPEMLDASAEFSRLLFEGCGNRMFATLYRNLKARLSFLRMATVKGRGDEDLEGVIVRLRAIASALERRDAEAASAACVERIRHAARLALARLVDDRAGSAKPRPRTGR